mmetsp:Transcript_28530/g.55877  ORF Transcript_28530/g.55877 Transcript_28530/m.55877 type:complete len:348 (-) Transcript_28530:807-1850(-)
MLPFLFSSRKEVGIDSLCPSPPSAVHPSAFPPACLNLLKMDLCSFFFVFFSFCEGIITSQLLFFPLLPSLLLSPFPSSLQLKLRRGLQKLFLVVPPCLQFDSVHSGDGFVLSETSRFEDCLVVECMEPDCPLSLWLEGGGGKEGNIQLDLQCALLTHNHAALLRLLILQQRHEPLCDFHKFRFPGSCSLSSSVITLSLLTGVGLIFLLLLLALLLLRGVSLRRVGEFLQLENGGVAPVQNVLVLFTLLRVLGSSLGFLVFQIVLRLPLSPSGTLRFLPSRGLSPCSRSRNTEEGGAAAKQTASRRSRGRAAPEKSRRGGPPSGRGPKAAPEAPCPKEGRSGSLGKEG